MKFVEIEVTDRPLTLGPNIAVKLTDAQTKGRVLEKAGKGRGVHYVSATPQQFKVGQIISIDESAVTKSMMRRDIVDQVDPGKQHEGTDGDQDQAGSE